MVQLKLGFISSPPKNSFRKDFLMLFYIALLLFRTLINRKLWFNPIMNVIGDEGLYSLESQSEDGSMSRFSTI